MTPTASRAAPARHPPSYCDPRDLWRDLRSLVRQRRAVLRLLSGGGLSPMLRERLMLTVTAVNDCRYCARLHTRLATNVGISAEETARLLAGSVGHCPEEELPALLYAQRWAEAEGTADAAARAELAATYGHERAAQIEAALLLIRMGNLFGNGWDRLIHRITAGRAGRGRRAPDDR